MTIERSELPGDALPDGSKAAHAGGSNGSLGPVVRSTGYGPTNYGPEPALDSPAAPHLINAADLARGFVPLEVATTPMFDDGSGEAPAGDPFTYGGFLGRPRGTSR